MTEKKPDLLQQADLQRLEAGYTPVARYFEITGIVGFFLTMAWVVWDFAGLMQSRLIPDAGWLIAGALIASLLFADFASGFFHWLADNWGSPEWPIIGPGLIRPFRHHHLDAEAMTRHDFVEINGTNCLISIPAFVAVHFLLTGPTVGSDLFWGVFWFGSACWVFGTNQFHAWAHTRHPPQLVLWAQRWRLILSPANHDLHHAPPHNRNYAITNGWTNGVTHRLHFYEGLEWLVTKVTGVRPQHAQAAAPSDPAPQLHG